MSEKVYRAIADASSGFVESPAGCGKTEAIVRAVEYCSGPQLILTHTHAGVDALRQRFRKLDVQIPRNKYHVDTIAGWSWNWVRRYPDNANYSASIEIPEWNYIYNSMADLLQKRFVSQGILNSYAGVIVDEYQDCTIPMHLLIVQLNKLLPCRILGDDLQGIFGFGGSAVVDWSDVKNEFANNLGALQTPHRWIKAGNECLGHWLLKARNDFRNEREPDYRNSPVDKIKIKYADLRKAFFKINGKKEGRICVIGPKARSLHSGIITTLVKSLDYRVLEPNDLSTLQDLIVKLSDGTPSDGVNASMSFLKKTHGGLSNEKDFIEKFLKGDSQTPHRLDRKALCETYGQGTLVQKLLGLIEYIGSISKVTLKLRASVSALKCILEEYIEFGGDLKSLYADEITKRKYRRQNDVYRCIGSTLLVKGLEFDHAIIIRDSDWRKNWGNNRDLYVALTRGCKSVTLIETEA